MMPQATPAPINDITGILSIPSYSAPLMIGGATAVVVLALLALWFFNLRTHTPQLSAKQKALAALASLFKSPGEAYDFGIQVSDVLRTYIRDGFGLDAVNQTSLEFLSSLRDHQVFDTNEKASLAAFLEASDLIKFARKDATSDELQMLLDTAKRLVNAEGEGTKKS